MNLPQLSKRQTTSEKHLVEPKQTLAKQKEMMEERYKLAMALQRARDGNTRLQEQQHVQSEYENILYTNLTALGVFGGLCLLAAINYQYSLFTS